MISGFVKITLWSLYQPRVMPPGDTNFEGKMVIVIAFPILKGDIARELEH